ncbi:MAG TPA: adenylate/guanylate cyclase domain-containing protein [Nitrosopumilaceae archaeon]|nr:adenylate/guanylate cyclase domain-containing protein [Nitrosopumilaceae archaeon]
MSEETPQEPPKPMKTKDIVDMMMGGNRSEIVDTETLIKEVQKRVWSSLKKGYEYDYSRDDSDKFLRQHVSSRVKMIVLYVDLVGSTQLTLELPAEKLAIIISSFSQEMGFVIKHHEGHVLKYVGDAVIGYFVAVDNPLVAADNAVNCGKSMISVIERGINPILNQYDYPDLKVKIGMDFGENTIVRYGADEIKSHVDILGPGMSIAAKITSLAKPNQILVGEDVYEKLHPSLKQDFNEVKGNEGHWDYRDRETGKVYRVFAYIG